MNKKEKKKQNYAFIDGANLHKGMDSLGWDLDYRRFRVWLEEKYQVTTAYIFIGLIPKYKSLYTFLQESGFILVYKEVVYDDVGKPKGNCDADLVLQATRDAYENKFDKAVLITSDGDYASLVKFLSEKGKFRVILSPHTQKTFSILLKRTNVPVTYLDDVRGRLEVGGSKRKSP